MSRTELICVEAKKKCEISVARFQTGYAHQYLLQDDRCASIDENYSVSGELANTWYLVVFGEDRHGLR